MESELVVVGSEGGQHHPDSGSTGTPRRRTLTVVPTATATTPPLHTIAEELNDCSDQSIEPPLASTRAPPLNPDEPPPYPGPPLTTSTNTSSSQHPQQASPTTLLPTDQPPDFAETVLSSHSRNEPATAAPHNAIQMQPYNSIEMPSYRAVPSAPMMPQQLVIDSKGFAVHPQLRDANPEALSLVNTLPQRTTSLENISTSMSGRFAASGVYVPQSQVSPWQFAAPLHPSSSMPGDSNAQIPVLDGTQTLTSPILFSLETGKYYVAISNPQPLSSQSRDDRNEAEFQHPSFLQRAAETERANNVARDSTTQLLPQPDVVSEERRPHSYFYCTVAMIFVFIICFDFLFLLLCLLPAACYAHKAAEAKYKRTYNEVVKYGNKALCFDVIGGIAHVVFIAVIITSILLILHYVARVF